MDSKIREQLDELERKAKRVFPVVSCRYGYATLIAYVYKIVNEDRPNEWWLVELNKDGEAASIQQICQYN